ncbi:MAG: ATP-binding protein [Pseudomonadota bacterium]
MRNRPARHASWIVAWLVLSVLGGVMLARLELSRLREAFETDARIAHRLLSQRAVQHDAVLATLALLQPASAGDPAEQRLPSVYPQILAVQRRDGTAAWPDAALQAAEAVSRSQRRPALADADFARGRYRMVLGADPASFALTLDLAAIVPWAEWPMPRETSLVQVLLEHAGQHYVVQPGRVQGAGWTFDFHKHLAADSQPFDVVAVRTVGWGELPWAWIVAWAVASAALLTGVRSLQRQRAARERAEELLRLGQVARLNAMGELAAGMAHELNQPLTAVIANTQAARRMLDDDPPDLATARDAMAQAVQQGRRASDVVGRLRHAVERPDSSAQARPVALQDAVRNAFYLLEPEFTRRHVTARIADAAPVRVAAEPVALEQIVHNLLMNALQALDQVPSGERNLTVDIESTAHDGILRVTDTGPGIAADAMPRIFEPFFTTRDGGLGLGLSLCETLAAGMGGRLQAAHHTPRGAEFRLTLPLATT